MPRYADWSHVTGRYKDAEKIADASKLSSYWLAHAEAEVDGRLASRYVVPFANTPTLTPLLVQDLVIDLCYLKIARGKAKKIALTTDLENRFKGLLNGTILITDMNGPIGPQANVAWGQNSYHTSFGMDNPINWRVSSESQQADQDVRGQFRGFYG